MIITKKEVRDELDELEEQLVESWKEFHELEDEDLEDDLTIDELDLNPPQLGNNSFFNYYENEILVFQSLFSFYNDMRGDLYSGEAVEDFIKKTITIQPKYMNNYIDWDSYCSDYLAGCTSLYHPNGTCFYEL